MNNEFNEFRTIKRSRKPHFCEFCNRTVPVGNKVHNYVGMYEGDFQNWYCCDFCFGKSYPTDEDYITGDEFTAWFLDNLLECPNCGKSDRHRDAYEFDDTKTIMQCHCSTCGHDYEIHIPFEIEEDNSK